MIDEICSAYGWDYEKPLKRTLYQLKKLSEEIAKRRALNVQILTMSIRVARHGNENDVKSWFDKFEPKKEKPRSTVNRRDDGVPSIPGLIVKG